MVSSYKVFNQTLAYRVLASAPCFAKLAYSQASLALSQRCRSRSVRAVRPASLAASAPYSACPQSPIKVGALQPSLALPSEQDRWLRPHRLGCSASISMHFTQLPVSQRLKPQCSVMQTHPSTKPSTALVKVALCSPGVWPRKSRYPRQRGRLSSSRLTLPSSGPAYGGPLKSNVRPRFKPHASHASCLKRHPETTSAVRCAGRALARNTGCRRRFE